MFRNKSVDVHRFSMIPSAEIPRSVFQRQSAHKTTFDAKYLVPVYVDEVLPGDMFKLNMTAFARLATPLYPVMDNLYLDSFFFFCPTRLVWSNWVKLQGEQLSPGDSIAYTVPTLTSPVGGYAVNSIFDYFGLPTVGQVGGGNTVTHNSLPLRCYNKIYNEWFRDENLCLPASINYADGPDNLVWYNLWTRGKRHDYFTSCLPYPQKSSTGVSLPLGTSANVFSTGSTDVPFRTASGTDFNIVVPAAGGLTPSAYPGAPSNLRIKSGVTTGLYADLSTATAATINQIREAFQIQRLLERDARSGTRYTEVVRAHFGVVSPDQRLQRPEYLGGGTTPILFTPIAQASATGLTGGTTPIGHLSGFAQGVARNHGFSQSFTEHGYIIGLVNVRADLNYQQGLRKLWSRSTRYDFYMPVFAHLGEQPVLNKEIYCDGSANDSLVFGYQERWAEYRHMPSLVTGLFRSTSAGTLDGWHLAQKFTALPALNSSFIQESPPLDRVLAVGAAANGKQILFDSVFDVRCVRCMPLYSVPGQIDRF